MKAPPEFHTDRLILRGITLADAPAYQKHFANYDIVKALVKDTPWPLPDDFAQIRIQDVILPYQGISKWVWGIFLKNKPDELIGTIGLRREGDPEHRSFWLGRAFWNKGYMTEAVTPINDYAFGTLGFEKLVFNNAAGNIGSRRIKEKTGARLLYTEPAEFVSPDYTMQEIWELTKEDWYQYRHNSGA